MENKKSNKIVIMLLAIIIVVLVMLCILLVTNKISFNFNEIGNSNQNISENSNDNELEEGNNVSDNNVSEENLKNIIKKQLFILFRYSDPVIKIENIDNKSKLLLALNILEDKYTTKSNDINTTIVNVSKSELEAAFNSSVISDLGIKHENFDLYELTGNTIYNRNTDLLVYSKEMYKYLLPQASKVKNYEKKNNQYIISMNYLFPDSDVGFEYYYGSLIDVKNGANSVVKAYDANGYIDAQKYLDENYNNIKDKLATYNYTFEIVNNKINLVNFSIN